MRIPIPTCLEHRLAMFTSVPRCSQMLYDRRVQGRRIIMRKEWPSSPSPPDLPSLLAHSSVPGSTVRGARAVHTRCTHDACVGVIS